MGAHPELGVSFGVVDDLRGFVGGSQSGDDALAGGGTDAAVEVLVNVNQPVPRGTASRECLD